MRHLRVEARSCMVCKVLDDGRVKGVATKCTVRIVVDIVHLQDRHLYVACVPLQPMAAVQVHDER